MLIDKTEIALHRTISKSVKDDKINPYIVDAELLDLSKMLGELLFNDVVKNPASTNNAKLMNATEYTYDGNVYNHVGLKKILAILSYARYIMFGSPTDTPFGYVDKNYNDGVPVSNASKRDIYTKERQTANEYFQNVKAYLDRNSDDFPLWNASCGTRNGFNNIRISKIT